jgi:hypothetical protein
MHECTGVMPVFGPTRPTLLSLRGIRLLEGEDGAKGGSGDDDKANDENDEKDDSAEKDETDDKGGEGEADSGLKKALTAERSARREADKKVKKLEQQLADHGKPADEVAVENARREAEAATLSKANERVVRSELKAAAATKVTRPDLLIKVTDLGAIDVDDDGEPDAEAIAQAIADFLKEYPELAVDKSTVRGSADQGQKGEKAKPKPPSFNDIVRAARTTP